MIQNGEVSQGNIKRVEMMYLCSDDDTYSFIDKNTFEMITLFSHVVGDSLKFVILNQVVTICLENGVPVAVEPPAYVELEVVATDPQNQAFTAIGESMQAIIETGAAVYVPLSIKAKDRIKIDTRTGEFVSKV